MSIWPQIKAFPDVRALFERLRADGIKVALASSAKGDELEAYKQKADILGLVEEETSSDDADRSKPHGDIFQAALDRLDGIAPADAIVVGDTPYDADAAGRVGLRTIGVRSGGFPDADLRNAGCVAIFKTPRICLRITKIFFERPRGRMIEAKPSSRDV